MGERMSDTLFRPVYTPDPSLASPSPATMGEVLDPVRFADLYRLAGEEGLPYFARVNASGDVELFLIFESVDSFSESTRDAVSVEFKTYRNKLLAVIWTLTDPLDPLGFPLAFDIRQAEERYMALRMVEQAETPLHYFAYEEGRLTHIFTEAITFSDEEAARVEEYIRLLYEGRQESLPVDAEVREEVMATIPATSLSEDVLSTEGVAYVLRYDRMRKKYGEEQAQHLLMSTLQQAVWVMRRHSRSEVRSSAFTVWAAEQGEILHLFVTPILSGLFPVVHSSEDESNPFTRFLLALPEFVETWEGSPLSVGAYPILRYAAGKLYHLELNEETQQQLAALFARNNPAQANPYC
jgi:hypothetical protein